MMGKLPATINRLVDRLREQAEPAAIFHFVSTGEECLRNNPQAEKRK